MRRIDDIPSSEITPKALYLRRREFLAGFAALVTGKKMVTTTDALTPREVVTSYNNFYEFGIDKSDPAKQSRRVQAEALVGRGRRRLRKARRLHARGHSQAAPARGARLPSPLRRGMVDRRAVGRLPARRSAEAIRADGQRGVRGVRHRAAPGGDAWPEGAADLGAAVAVQRRAADRRGDAFAGADGGRPVRRGAAEPERRAAAAGGALEVRLQEHQVDRRRSASSRSSRTRRG